MSKKLTDILANLNEKHGKGAIMLLDKNSGKDTYDRIPTGSIGLDRITGGGYPLGRMIELLGWESSGKAQPLTSKVLTPNGWATMGDLKIGSSVSTPDGGESTIIGVYPQGEQDVYEVTLDDKTTARCTLDHLWSVKGRLTDVYEVLTTEELLKRKLKKKNGARKFQIPRNSPIEFTNASKELPINPYLLGVLIGDGGLTSSVTVTNQDDYIINRLYNIIEKDHIDTILKKISTTISYRFSKKVKGPKKCSLHSELIKIGLYGCKSEVKFIPKEYLVASVADRTALLQGLMDTDGTSSFNGNSFSYTTVSPQLKEDFEELARGLGFRVTTSSKIGSYVSKTGNRIDCQRAYRMSMTVCEELAFNPFSLPRKAENVDISKKSEYSGRFIESIKKVGKEECQCISIGHPDQLYITDNYIVTHNTTVALHAIQQAQNQGLTCAFIDAEQAFDAGYAECLGINLSKLILVQPDNGESALEIARDLVDSGEVKLIIIDSVATLIPKSELEGEVGDNQMGLQARMMSKATRMLAGPLNKHNTCLIFINQFREKIGVMFGDNRSTPGGNALKYYASIRLDLTGYNSKTELNKEGVKVAKKVKAKCIKNKTAPPFGECEYMIEFGKGIDKVGEILELAVLKGVVTKKGGHHSYGEIKLGNGAANVKRLLNDNEELLEEIEKLTI